MEPILSVENLSVSFQRYGRGLSRVELCAVRDLSLRVEPGQLAAVVGESGSGKSLLAHAILHILPRNAQVSGTIRYDGLLLTSRRAEELRGREIALIPQGITCLDPMMKVGPQVRRGENGYGYYDAEQFYDFYAIAIFRQTGTPLTEIRRCLQDQSAGGTLALLREQRERLGEERRLDYGQTLLGMVSKGRDPAALLRTATSMSAGKRAMRERIALIVKAPRTRKLTLALAVLLACALAACSFGGREAKAPEGTEPSQGGAGGIPTAATICQVFSSDIRDTAHITDPEEVERLWEMYQSFEYEAPYDYPKEGGWPIMVFFQCGDKPSDDDICFIIAQDVISTQDSGYCRLKNNDEIYSELLRLSESLAGTEPSPGPVSLGTEPAIPAAPEQEPPALMEFPGLRWNGSVETVIQSLNIQEDHILENGPQEGTEDGWCLAASGVSAFGRTADTAYFYFARYGDSDWGLHSVRLDYPNGAGRADPAVRSGQRVAEGIL